MSTKNDMQHSRGTEYEKWKEPTKQQSVRTNHGFAETMGRHFANMENALYAAEVYCPDYNHIPYCKDELCPFYARVHSRCMAKELRSIMGEHVEQHDVEARR